MMSKLSIHSFLILVSKRAYTVAPENVRMQSAVSVMRKVTDPSSEVPAGQNGQVFWMKDPKTGNFMPENHFNDIDVVELREKVLLKKGNF